MTTTHINLGTEINLDELGVLENSQYDEVGHYQTPSFCSVKLAIFDKEVQGVKLYDYFGIGGWTEEGAGRIEYLGPIVNGPHAYLISQPVVISLQPKDDDFAIDVEIGSTIIARGSKFEIVDGGRNSKPTLQLIKETERVGA